jgi:hypothetical protein
VRRHGLKRLWRACRLGRSRAARNPRAAAELGARTSSTREGAQIHSTLARARRRLSFANVTSALALFVALGGTSYAAVVLPANSVDSREIRRDAVGPSEIRAGAAGASELRTDSVRVSEIRAAAVRASEIASNAVGVEEIAAEAVGEEEVATGAIGTLELRDGQVDLADLSPATRTALVEAGAVTFRAAVTSAGAIAGGTPSFVNRTGTGEYDVSFPRDVAACQFAGTLAAVRVGGGLQQPPAGRITAAPGGAATTVVVRTFGVDGAAADAPFHLLVAC